MSIDSDIITNRDLNVTWNKGKLQNRYRARWAKGKTGIGLDEHRARQSLVGLSAHCANSYIPHVQHIIQYMCAPF